MVTTIDFFLNHFPNKSYANLGHEFRKVGVNNTQDLENKFINLRSIYKKSRDYPLSNFFNHVGFDVLFYQINRIDRLYQSQLQIVTNPMIRQAIADSLQREPREAEWAIRDYSGDAYDAIKEMEDKSPIISGLELRHALNRLKSIDQQERIKQIGLDPLKFKKVLQDSEKIMEELQQAEIRKYLEAEFKKQRHIVSILGGIRRSIPQNTEFEKEQARYRRGERKTPPKFSLRTKSLVPDDHAKKGKRSRRQK